jgi:hypothetical protein
MGPYCQTVLINSLQANISDQWYKEEIGNLKLKKENMTEK